jgi:hypothetical protein
VNAKHNMPRGKEISEDNRTRVVGTHLSGEGYNIISKRFELLQFTVRQTIYVWKAFNMTATRPRSGQTPFQNIPKGHKNNNKSGKSQPKHNI